MSTLQAKVPAPHEDSARYPAGRLPYGEPARCPADVRNSVAHYTFGYGKTPGEGVVRRTPEADRPGVHVHGEAGQVVHPAADGGRADPGRPERSPGAPGPRLGVDADP